MSHERGGGRWKSQNRKNVYLSPYVEEPLNSKVIENFVPELRSRKCFSCFESPMFDVYVMNILMYVSHIVVSGYGTAVVKSHFGIFTPLGFDFQLSVLPSSFVPELRSRKCFSCIEIPMFYVIYIYEHYMSISHIHIWICYTHGKRKSGKSMLSKNLNNDDELSFFYINEIYIYIYGECYKTTPYPHI